jgi:hypothetical protein
VPSHRNAWNAMECPQEGRGVCSGKLPAIYSTLHINCMNEVKTCFGKGFGWICALYRWLVQECAYISFCPKSLQVLNYLARELCRRIDTLFISVGGQEGGLGGGTFLAGGPKFTQLNFSYNSS